MGNVCTYSQLSSATFISNPILSSDLVRTRVHSGLLQPRGGEVGGYICVYVLHTSYNAAVGLLYCVNALAISELHRFLISFRCRSGISFRLRFESQVNFFLIGDPLQSLNSSLVRLWPAFVLYCSDECQMILYCQLARASSIIDLVTDGDGDDDDDWGSIQSLEQ